MVSAGTGVMYESKALNKEPDFSPGTSGPLPSVSRLLLRAQPLSVALQGTGHTVLWGGHSPCGCPTQAVGQQLGRACTLLLAKLPPEHSQSSGRVAAVAGLQILAVILFAFSRPGNESSPVTPKRNDCKLPSGLMTSGEDLTLACKQSRCRKSRNHRMG